jgi:hypothetical protein
MLRALPSPHIWLVELEHRDIHGRLLAVGERCCHCGERRQRVFVPDRTPPPTSWPRWLLRGLQGLGVCVLACVGMVVGFYVLLLSPMLLPPLALVLGGHWLLGAMRRALGKGTGLSAELRRGALVPVRRKKGTQEDG